MRLRMILLVFALVAGACSSDGVVDASTTSSTLGLTDPARQQFEWLLEASKAGELGAEALAQRFSAEFLDAVGDLGIIQGLVELGLTTGEWEVVESDFGLFEGVAVLRNQAGDTIQMLVGTRSYPPYQIDDLRARPIDAPAGG